MDRKAFNLKMAEYNKALRDLERETKTVKTKEGLLDVQERTTAKLTEKMEFEKEQLDELQQIVQERILKKEAIKTERDNKKIDHCKYILGGEITKQLGTFPDKHDDSFKQIESYLQSKLFLEDYKQTEEERERKNRLCVLGSIFEDNLGTTDDKDVFEKAQIFLNSKYFKSCFLKFFEQKEKQMQAQIQATATPNTQNKQ